MPSRTTEGKVRALIGSSADKEAFEPFVDTAAMIVTDSLASAGYSDERLELIERWLAAHLYSCAGDGRQVEKREVADAAESYGKLGMGLDSTTFGQQVKLLDEKGILAAASAGKSASFLRVVG